MIITVLILFILSSAVVNEKEKSIIYSRLSIQSLLLASFILYNNIFVKFLEKGIGLYGGMFSINTFTQSFNLFIILIASVILILTSFNRTSVYSIMLHFKSIGVMCYYMYNSSKIEYNKFNELGKQSISITNEDKNKSLNTKYTSLIHMIINTIKKSVKSDGQLEIIEYALITMFIISGAIFLMSAVDLISIFLAIELQSYGLYILCTLYRDSESSTNSGLTYFLLGCMSSCFILFGSGLFYVNSGTTNLENIYIVNSIDSVLYAQQSIYYLYLPNYITISLVIIIVGFLFKVSAAPFHFWSPDVYDGIPTVVTTFVAIIPKISIFIFILQLVLNTYILPSDASGIINISYFNPISTQNLYSQSNWSWKDIILISSLMSLIIGSLLGLTQHRIKRLFAYSTISHVGFILLALSVSTMESIQGYVFYIIQYTISNVNAFFILVAMGFVLNKRSQFNNVWPGASEFNNSPIQLVNQLKGYFYVNSYIAISLAITLFSFVGIPPLIGFFAKQMVLSAALAEGYVFITLVAVITSVIGAVYYLNIIKNMFFFNLETSNLNHKENNNLKSPLPVRGPGVNQSFYSLLVTSSAEGQTKQQIDISKRIKSNLYTKEQVNMCINIDYYNVNKVNSALNAIISILTFVILTFIFMPNEWLRVASILSTILFKL